jgi:hypothetical protein
MELEVLRISSQADSTNGILFDVTDGVRKFLCYTIEDEYRAEKIRGETRIPEGEYKLTLRTEGGYHQRYTAKYGDWHRGMIYVNNVPKFRVDFMAHGEYRRIYGRMFDFGFISKRKYYKTRRVCRSVSCGV